MKIGLIDADLLDAGTRHPNLALMKISGYMKAMGNQVELLLDYTTINSYDQVYISKVFTFTKVPDHVFENSNITIGGTGFFPEGGPDLELNIEHHMPDYTLYNHFISNEIIRGINPTKYSDYTDYSIGFSTRGCFRKCEFCVNKKYDRVLRHSSIDEFFDKSRRHIYLWDDNFLAFKDWRLVLDELEQTNRYFQFRQGLDIRCMTEEQAKRLTSMKYKGDFIFAFDHIKDRELIEKKLIMWRKITSKTTKMYVLSAFDSQDEKDIESVFERILILMKYKCLPYIMRYESVKGSKYEGMYINLARWCNQPNFFKKKSFREFCVANQAIAKSDRICASLKYIEIFEKDHPEIANKYFDIRYDSF